MRRSIILPFVLCGCELMGRTKAEGVRELAAEVGVWPSDGGSSRRREEIEENEIGGTCGTCGTQYKCVRACGE